MSDGAPHRAVGPRSWPPLARVLSGIVLLMAIVLTSSAFALFPHPINEASEDPQVASPVSPHGGWSFSDEQDSWGSVSCASPRFCMAGGSDSLRPDGTSQTAQFVLFDGSSWKVTLAQVPEQNTNIALSVSCPTVGWCVGYDNLDNGYWIYSNSAWSPQHRLPLKLSAVGEQVTIACASRTFCMAIDPARYAVYNGRTWTTGRVRGGSADGVVGGLACAPATHFCVVAVENSGPSDLLIYHRGGWTVSYRGLRFSTNLDSSCASSFCLVTNGTKVVAYSRGKWSRQLALPSPPAVPFTPALPSQTSVSCPASEACYLLSTYGAFQTFSDGRLSSPTAPSGPVADGWSPLSCPTTAFCMLVGADDPVHDVSPGYYTYRYVHVT